MMSRYILIFFIFSFFGWVWESIYCTLRQKKWANRGFLYGPICPIYGCGCLLALATYDLAAAGRLPELPWWGIFLLGFAVSMVLEYPTSWALETLFHARWWDYSKVPLNLNGRTSVPTSIAFGAASILVMKVLMPPIASLVSLMPDWLCSALSLVFTAVISADITLTASALTDFQNSVRQLDASFQSHMTDKVYQILSAENDFRHKAVARIAVFQRPLERSRTARQNRAARYDALMEEYRNSAEVKSMGQFLQHGDTTTLEHCENVAWISFLVNEKLRLNADERTLVEAAVLHDFYLYDWHDGKPERKRHGFDHPEIARNNAVERFQVPEATQSAILSHMWPLNIGRIPKSKEAAILCLVDKYCALVETMRLSKRLGLK